MDQYTAPARAAGTTALAWFSYAFLRAVALEVHVELAAEPLDPGRACCILQELHRLPRGPGGLGVVALQGHKPGQPLERGRQPQAHARVPGLGCVKLLEQAASGLCRAR